MGINKVVERLENGAAQLILNLFTVGVADCAAGRQYGRLAEGHPHPKRGIPGQGRGVPHHLHETPAGRQHTPLGIQIL